MVAAPHREGGQAQFAARARPRPAARWSRPGAGPRSASSSPSTSPRWPRHAGVSPRTFARRFREETGTTPLQWLLAQRVLEARRLLEESDLPVETVAWRCGFGTAASLREHFRRATATTPTAYRRSFQPSLTLSPAKIAECSILKLSTSDCRKGLHSRVWGIAGSHVMELLLRPDHADIGPQGQESRPRPRWASSSLASRPGCRGSLPTRGGSARYAASPRAAARSAARAVRRGSAGRASVHDIGKLEMPTGYRQQAGAARRR